MGYSYVNCIEVEALQCIKFRNQDGFITKKEMAQVAKRLSQNQVRFIGVLEVFFSIFFDFFLLTLAVL